MTVRYEGRLHRIDVGRAYKGWRVILLVAGTEVLITGEDNSPLRQPHQDSYLSPADGSTCLVVAVSFPKAHTTCCGQTRDGYFDVGWRGCP